MFVPTANRFDWWFSDFQFVSKCFLWEIKKDSVWCNTLNTDSFCFCVILKEIFHCNSRIPTRPLMPLSQQEGLETVHCNYSTFCLSLHWGCFWRGHQLLSWLSCCDGTDWHENMRVRSICSTCACSISGKQLSLNSTAMKRLSKKVLVSFGGKKLSW